MNDEFNYGVWCEVSGGVTGSRQAWLKSNGERVEFVTLAEAQEEADRLQRARLYSAGAHFRYTARELWT